MGRGVRNAAGRRRGTALLVAAAALVVPFAAGCAGGGGAEAAQPTTVVTAASPQPVPLTQDVAEKQFRAFVANEDVARAAGDEKLGLAWVSDGESALLAAEFRKAIFEGDPVPRYVYGDPELYVPKLGPDIYPQWFVAKVSRKVRDESGRAKKDSEHTVLMAFILRAPGERWTLSLTTELDPEDETSKIAVDDDGYAQAVNTADETVLIRPREVPGIQATMAAEGPDSVAAKVMRKGAFTTGYYEDTEKAERKARKKGLTQNTVYTATSYPIFSLRTEDGGAVVLYSLYRSKVFGVDKDGDRTEPPIPDDAAHLLDGTVEGDEVHVQETFQYAAYDPKRPDTEGGDGDGEGGDGKSAKAEIIGQAGGVRDASTPPKKQP